MKLLGIDPDTLQLRLPLGSPYRLRLYVSIGGVIEDMIGQAQALTIYRGGTVVQTVAGVDASGSQGPCKEFYFDGASPVYAVGSGLTWEVPWLFADGKTPLLQGPVYLAAAAPATPQAGLSAPSGAADELTWSPADDSVIVVPVGTSGASPWQAEGKSYAQWTADYRAPLDTARQQADDARDQAAQEATYAGDQGDYAKAQGDAAAGVVAGAASILAAVPVAQGLLAQTAAAAATIFPLIRSDPGYGLTIDADGAGYIRSVTFPDGSVQSPATPASAGPGGTIYTVDRAGWAGPVTLPDGQDAATRIDPRPIAGISADRNLFVGDGQSLSRGQAAALIQTAAVAGGEMFTAVRPDDTSFTAALAFASINPLVETSWSGRGETGLAGFVSAYDQLRQARGIPSLAAAAKTLLCVAAGRGSTAIANLSPGYTFQEVTAAKDGTLPVIEVFDRIRQSIQRGKALSDAQGKSFEVSLLKWHHGNADQNALASADYYKLLLRCLWRAFSAEATRVTGRDLRRPMILSQYSGQGSDRPAVALAQLALANELRDVILSTPAYPFDYAVVNGTPNEHMTAQSYRFRDAFDALAAMMLFDQGVKFRPLQPLVVRRDGRYLVAEMDVQSGTPLSIDTSYVTDPGGYGFSAVAADGTDLGVIGNGVQVAGSRLYVPCATRPLPGAMLRAGFVGGNSYPGPTLGRRICLRDNAADIFTDPVTGVVRNLFRYCVTFEMGAIA